MKLKVGDSVLVKLWEELEGKYGVDKDGDIPVDGDLCFTTDMKKLCGKLCQIAEIRDENRYFLSNCDDFNFCDEMLEPLEPIEKQLLSAPSPVITFGSQQQAEEYLAYWQDKLFLNNWIIDVKLVEPEEIEGCQGGNSFVHSLMSSFIRISKHQEETSVTKECHEQTLVHELLHLKYNLMNSDSKSYESEYLYAEEHRLLEQLAKSLIMVKYNLSFDWFKNF